MEGVKIPKELAGVLVSTDDTLSGAIRFVGTRVPVQALIDTIASGAVLDDFLEGFPNVSQEQAEAVLAWEHDQARKLLGLERAS
jgi:uncharacterized protein (DUF433 family)